MKGQLSPPADNTSLVTAQDTISHLCSKYKLLAHIQFGVHRDLQVLFYKAIFQLDSPQHILMPEVVLPQVQDLEFVCLADDAAREHRPVIVTTSCELQLK